MITMVKCSYEADEYGFLMGVIERWTDHEQVSEMFIGDQEEYIAQLENALAEDGLYH